MDFAAGASGLLISPLGLLWSEVVGSEEAESFETNLIVVVGRWVKRPTNW